MAFYFRSNAAAPEGTPPRRIRTKDLQKLQVPPCLGNILQHAILGNNNNEDSTAKPESKRMNSDNLPAQPCLGETLRR